MLELAKEVSINVKYEQLMYQTFILLEFHAIWQALISHIAI